MHVHVLAAMFDIYQVSYMYKYVPRVCVYMVTAHIEMTKLEVPGTIKIRMHTLHYKIHECICAVCVNRYVMYFGYPRVHDIYNFIFYILHIMYMH